MKRVITIQDISCIGKCSLTVALPIISAMGIETCVLPTAVLSTHTAFNEFTFRDLTSDISKISNHWKNEKIHFDGIYTGYLGSLEQIELVGQFIKDFGGTDTVTIIDPCMGDNGKLYSGFTNEFASSMAKLCQKADVILPNMTEASYLLGIPYLESGYSVEYITEILKNLGELGAKKVVLKGIQFPDNRADFKGTNGKIGIAAYDREKDLVRWYFHKKMPENFHGTGDIFASVFTGALVQKLPFDKAYALAADFVVEAIKETLSHPDYNWYGVDFETCIPYLLGRL